MESEPLLLTNSSGIANILNLSSLLFFSGQRMLEDFQTHLKKEEERRGDSQDKLDRSSKILVNVKSGVEHLADKLQHLKAVSFEVTDLISQHSAVVFGLSIT